uniref:Uncharacterized protein n=1 Tax=Pristionchus pacificus TaxID=54126 RepID=A0A2A6CHT2_PRIPA|eukprot:PDM77647.1 hypothetical protein PRIPAC_34514 [Pristionchus pacificus]
MLDLNPGSRSSLLGNVDESGGLLLGELLLIVALVTGRRRHRPHCGHARRGQRDLRKGTSANYHYSIPEPPYTSSTMVWLTVLSAATCRITVSTEAAECSPITVAASRASANVATRHNTRILKRVRSRRLTASSLALEGRPRAIARCVGVIDSHVSTHMVQHAPGRLGVSLLQQPLEQVVRAIRCASAMRRGSKTKDQRPEIKNQRPTCPAMSRLRKPRMAHDRRREL